MLAATPVASCLRVCKWCFPCSPPRPWLALVSSQRCSGSRRWGWRLPTPAASPPPHRALLPPPRAPQAKEIREQAFEEAVREEIEANSFDDVSDEQVRRELAKEEL